MPVLCRRAPLHAARMPARALVGQVTLPAEAFASVVNIHIYNAQKDRPKGRPRKAIADTRPRTKSNNISPRFGRTQNQIS